MEKQIKEQMSSRDKVDIKRKDELTAIEEDVQKISANIQVGPHSSNYNECRCYELSLNDLTLCDWLLFAVKVTNRELALFQQKLEEEVKKDQKEKKANQEVLRSLRTETDELLKEQGR